jgi:tetratricopeptide (TPR) repeat protein
VVETAEALHWYSDTTMARRGWYEVYGSSRAAAAELGDRRLETVHLNYLSWAASNCARRWEEGLRTALAARDIAAEEGDLKEEAWALQYAADALNRAGRHAEALEMIRAALRPADLAGDHDGYVQLFIRMGGMQTGLRHYEEALTTYREGLRETAARPVAARPALSARAGARVHIAHVLALLGRWTQALEEAGRAEPLAAAYGVPALACRLHLARGLALAGLGERTRARAELRRALELIDDNRSHPLAGEVREALAALAAPTG